MIASLKGKVASKGDGRVVLDVGGVGYLVHMAQSSVVKLAPVGEGARVLCIMSVSDAGAFLYGFVDERERSMFEMLTGVSGVGPKMALAALTAYDVAQLESAIAMQDVKAVSKVPGIGKKIASRIILELKDSFEAEPLPDGGASSEGAVSESVVVVSEALSSMGFTSAEIEVAIAGADDAATESELLQYALRRMA